MDVGLRFNGAHFIQRHDADEEAEELVRDRSQGASAFILDPKFDTPTAYDRAVIACVAASDPQALDKPK